MSESRAGTAGAPPRHGLTGGPPARTPTVGAAIGRRVRDRWSARPEWLADELHIGSRQAVAQFVDFAAFVRLWRLRRQIALLTYEQRLYAADDPALQRAYYAGLVGHQTGVAVCRGRLPRATSPRPYASAVELRSTILAAPCSSRRSSAGSARTGGATRSPAQLVDRVAAAASTRRTRLRELGYDALDWRPVLRQIRTRLIGEMSGYGGPNITTRAGTRKV